MVKFNSLRTLLALAAIKDWELHHLDVKTAFLQGELTETIYMKQPEGFIQEGREDLVCELNKALYGTKQAPREWNRKLDKTLQNLGFKRMKTDNAIYIRSTGPNILILAVYVDDLGLFGDSIDEVTKLKEELMKKFQMKDLGEMKYFLGMHVTRDRKNRLLRINQKSYIEDVAKRFGMDQAKPARTPLPPKINLQKRSRTDDDEYDEETRLMAKVPYAEAVGCLIYAIAATRFDISYAVSAVSRYMSNPGQIHWKAVKQIIQYLNSTKDFTITYGCKQENGTSPIGFSDANFAADLDDRKSLSGYVFTVNGAAVFWNCKKQSVVATSTTEAEYISLSMASSEAVWIRSFFNELGLTQNEPTLIYGDNQGSLALSKNPKFHARSKHIDIKYHFIRDLVEREEITLNYIQTDNMLADAFTKSLPESKHMKCITELGLLPQTKQQHSNQQ